MKEKNLNTATKGTAMNRGRSQQGSAAVVILVILAVVALGAFFVVRQDGQFGQIEHPGAQTQPIEVNDDSHNVQLDVSLPDGVSSQGMLLPVRAVGTDADNNSVDLTVAVKADGTGLSLKKGTYTVAAAAGAIASDGSYYEPNGATISVSINSDVEPGDTVEATTLPLAYQAVDESQLTDDQISRACDALTTAGVDSGEVSSLRQKAVSVRDSAVAKAKADAEAKAKAEAQAKAEAEAKAKADAEAKAKSAMHVETAYFSVDLPTSWYGQVNVVKDSDESVGVYDKTSNQMLVSFSVVPSSEELNMGDYSASMVDYRDNGSRRVEMWLHDWAAVYAVEVKAGNNYAGLDETTYDRLIRLQTNGTMSTADFPTAMDTTNQKVFSGRSFYENSVFPTLRLK